MNLFFANFYSHPTESSTSTGGALSGGGAFASADQLKSFIDIIVPLLIQCWIEAGPSQLAVKLPGKGSHTLNGSDSENE